jgi:hypothetical protein
MSASVHSAGGKAGFTIVEFLVAGSIGVLVAAGVVTSFVWCGKQAVQCSKVAWSQDKVMRTSAKLSAYLRNAAKVESMDMSQGTWVRVRVVSDRFPTGEIVRLYYTNAAPQLRDGRLLLQRSNGTEILVARGLTEVMDERGYTLPIFSRARDNALRIAYRVAEPVATGGSTANDSRYAASARFGACLRNVMQQK